MQITDYPPAPNGTRQERLGLVIKKLADYLEITEAQQIQSLGDLQKTATDVTTQINTAIATLTTAVAAHANLTGAQHGETAEQIGLGRLNNWRNSVASDIANETYSDEVYLTSDIAKQLSDALVEANLENFMVQGQLPLAYFEGGQYGSLISEFRNKISYLSTQLGLMTATTNSSTKLLRVNGATDIRSSSYPMQSKKKISFLSNNDEYLFTAPGDKYGIKSYGIDKFFLSSVIQEGLNPLVQEVTDQPYLIRNVGWGATNQAVTLVNDSNLYTLFNEDFYLGQDKPVQLIMNNNELNPANYLSIPGSCLFNTIGVAGSIQAGSDGVSFFLGNATFNYPEDDVGYPSINIDAIDLSSVTFVSPVDPSNVSPIVEATDSNFLGLNGTDNYLGLTDQNNQQFSFVVGSSRSGITIPWDNFINILLNDHSINIVDYSDVDAFFNYGTLVWEYPGVSLLGYVDAVLNFLNDGSPLTYTFRCSFRITLGENILIELLSSVLPSTISSAGITNGNTLFTHKESDPFHPVYGRGAFLGFGGHVTGMTRETDITIVIAEHQFASIEDYISGYFNTPDYSRLEYLKYPAQRTSVVSAAPRRIMPLSDTADGTQLLVVSPDANGEISSKMLNWSEGNVLYAQPNANSQYIIRSPNYANTEVPSGTLPSALLAVISGVSGVNLSSLVFGGSISDSGNEFYTVGTTIMGGKTWGMSQAAVGIFTQVASDFIAKANAQYAANNITPTEVNQKSNWLVVLKPSGTDASTIAIGYLIVTDSCGAVGYVQINIVPDTTNLVFNITNTVTALDANLVIGLSPSPDFTQDSVSSGWEFYDACLSVENNQSFLQLSRCFGTKHGGCVLNLSTGKFINIDPVQSELGDYPVSTDYIANFLPIPGEGSFYLQQPSTGVMSSAGGTKLLDFYADEEAASIVDTDGVAKYQYFIPAGTQFILAGFQYTLSKTLDCLFDAAKTCYLYLSLDTDGISVIPSLTLRQPTVYEVLYGQGSNGIVGMTTTPYCVIDGKLMSEGVIGSGIPMTEGLSMDAGSSAWKLK